MIFGFSVAQYAAFGFLPLLMLLAAANDITYFRIPNWISIALVAGFFVAAPLVGMSAANIGMHFSAGAIALGLGFIAFGRGWVGAGDAKLFAATALWMGFESAGSYAVVASLMGGLLAICFLGLRQIALLLPVGAVFLTKLQDFTKSLPYGVALGSGALLVYPQTDIFRALMMH